MIRVFTIDNTEQGLYFNAVANHVDKRNIDTDSSLDRAAARLGRKTYDLIIMSRGTGRLDLYDIADVIKQSRLNKSADIIILEDNPTVATRLQGMLKGRRVYRFKSNQIAELDYMLERMAA